MKSYNNSEKIDDFKLSEENLQIKINEVNMIIKKFYKNSEVLKDTLKIIKDSFLKIQFFPNDIKVDFEEYEHIKIKKETQSLKIKEYSRDKTIKNVGIGLGMVVLGTVAISSSKIGSSIASRFGKSSTGTAISSLKGIAKNNAVEAWLGGGAISKGGGGIKSGKSRIKFIVKIGMGIMKKTPNIYSILSKFDKKNKQRLENIYLMKNNRDLKYYEQFINETNEYISKILNNNIKLNYAIKDIESFGLDYNLLNDNQKNRLKSYENLISSSVELLNNIIKSFNSKFSMFSIEDFNEFLSYKYRKTNNIICNKHKNYIVKLANEFCYIEIKGNDKQILMEFIKRDSEKLKILNITKKELNIDIINAVFEALDYKYMLEKNRKQ